MTNKQESPKYYDGGEELIELFFDAPESKLSEKINTILNNSPSWAQRYHLSPFRKQILSWYEFNPEARLLEVGAGCGAVTGLFCDRVKEVVADELEKKRVEVLKARHSDRTNLTVIQKDIFDFNKSEQFDYVTVIGVLEYAGLFSQTGEDRNAAYQRFLESVAQLIKPNKGHLLLAIENKLGLRYLAGFCEDHTRRFYNSIENFPNYNGVMTFSQSEITQMLLSAGFKKINFYYPLPDYKLPNMVVGADFLNENFNSAFSSFIQAEEMAPLPQVELFNEIALAKTLAKEKVLNIFANSFLIDATL